MLKMMKIIKKADVSLDYHSASFNSCILSRIYLLVHDFAEANRLYIDTIVSVSYFSFSPKRDYSRREHCSPLGKV
jgi:hypothetical protein